MALVYPLIPPRRVLAAAYGRFLSLDAESLCLAYVGELEFREISDSDELGPAQRIPLPGIVCSLKALDGSPQRIAALLNDGSVHVLAYRNGEMKETHHFVSPQPTKALVPSINTKQTAMVAPTSLRTLFIGDIGNQGLWFTAPLTGLVLSAVFVESRLIAIAFLTVQRSTSLSFYRIKVQSKSLGPPIRTVAISDVEPVDMTVIESSIVITFRQSVVVVTTLSSFTSQPPKEIVACEYMGDNRFLWVHPTGSVSEASVNLENGGLTSKILWDFGKPINDALVVAAGPKRVFLQIPGGLTALALIERQELKFTHTLSTTQNIPTLLRHTVDDNGASTLYCGGYQNDPMFYESVFFGASAIVQEPLEYTNGLSGVWNIGDGLFAISSAQQTCVLARREGMLRPLVLSGWITNESTIAASESIQVTPKNIVSKGHHHPLPYTARFACIAGSTVVVAHLSGEESLVQWLETGKNLSVREEKHYPGAITALSPSVVCCNQRLYVEDRQLELPSLPSSVLVDEDCVYVGLVCGTVILYRLPELIEVATYDIGKGTPPRLLTLGDGRKIASGERTIAISSNHSTEISSCPPILGVASLGIGGYHLIISEKGMHVCEFEGWNSVSVKRYEGVPGSTLDVGTSQELWSAAGYLVRHKKAIHRLDFSQSIDKIYALPGGNCLYASNNEIGILNSSFERVDHREFAEISRVYRNDNTSFLVLHQGGFFLVEITLEPPKLHVGDNLEESPVWDFERCDVSDGVILFRSDHAEYSMAEWHDMSRLPYVYPIVARDEPPAAALLSQKHWCMVFDQNKTLHTFYRDSKMGEFVLGDAISAFCRPAPMLLRMTEKLPLKPSLFFATENGGLYLYALLEEDVVEPLKRLQDVISHSYKVITRPLADFQGFSQSENTDIDGSLLNSYMSLAQNVREDMCREAGILPSVISNVVNGIYTILH